MSNSALEVWNRKIYINRNLGKVWSPNRQINTSFRHTQILGWVTSAILACSYTPNGWEGGTVLGRRPVRVAAFCTERRAFWTIWWCWWLAARSLVFHSSVALETVHSGSVRRSVAPCRNSCNRNSRRRWSSMWSCCSSNAGSGLVASFCPSPAGHNANSDF